jgi:primosomal replication protein N
MMLIAMLAVSQKGPSAERRYRCRMSFQASVTQSGQSVMAVVKSTTASVNLRGVGWFSCKTQALRTHEIGLQIGLQIGLGI